MKTNTRPQHGQQASSVEQEFWASADMPYLEIRTTRDSQVAYAPHFHHTFFVGLIMKGQTLVTLGKEPVTAREGDIVLVAPDLVHSCNPVGGCQRSYLALYLDPRWCGELLCGEGPAEREMLLAVRQPLVRDKALFAGLAGAARAVREGAPSGEEALMDVCKRLLSGFCELRKRAAPTALPAKADRARQAIAGGEGAGAAHVAREYGMRREVFIRSFRKVTGLPPGMYGHCLRLEEGRRLLRSGLPIAEVALATGYADQSHFHRMFVKYFAATPRQYRKIRSQSFKK